MALKFKCGKCQQDIIVQFLEIGEIAVCKNCGEDNTIPESAENIEEDLAIARKREQSETPEYIDPAIDPNRLKHDSVKTSGFMEHSGKLYEKVGGDRSYWALKLIASGHRMYGLLAFLVSIGCIVVGVYFLAAQERFNKVYIIPLFAAAFSSFTFGLFMLLIKEIIMLVVNVSEDFSVIAKEASEIRKAIVDKSD